MFINKDSLKVNGVNFGTFLTEIKYSYNKLWSDDSGRNLAGSMSGTLIGIFPKLTLTFRSLSKQELETVTTILDSANQTVQYYDPNKKQNVTLTTYAGDYEVSNKNINKNESFSVSLISTKKRD